MRIERTRNAKRNMTFGACRRLVGLLLSFVTRTVILRTLGAEYLGLDSLFASVLQVLNLSELGFGAAIVYSMYKPIAENDTEKICALLGLYRTAYKIIGTVILVGGLCVAPILPKIIRRGRPAGADLYLLYFIHLLNAVISYMMFAYKAAVFEAFNRNDVISKIDMFVKALTSLVQISLLLAYGNYYAYLIALPLFTILNNLMLSFLARKDFPQYVCGGEVPGDMRRDLKKNIAAMTIFKLCSVSRNSLDSVFVSAFLGLAMTAMYANYFTVISAVTGVMGIFSASISAGVGNGVAMDDEDANFRVMRRMDFAYMLLGGWSSVCLLCLCQPFMRIWAGEGLVLPFGAVVLLVLYYYALKIGDIRGVYVQADGLWWENRWRYVLEAATNIILNYVLGKAFGIYGIIGATLISLLLFNIYGARLVFDSYFKKQSLRGYWRGHMRYAATTAGVGIVTCCACAMARGTDWAVLVMRAGICCAVPPPLYFLAYRGTRAYAETMPWLLEKFSLQDKLEFLISKGNVKN